jgi:hypothetical protein
MTTYIESAKFFNLRGRTITNDPTPFSELHKTKLSNQIETVLQADKGFGHLFGSPSKFPIAAAPLIFEISDMPIYARKVLVDYLLETFKEQSHA